MNDAPEQAAPQTRMKRFGRGRRHRTTVWRLLAVMLTSAALLVGAAIPAGAAELMRVTFVRHGESEGNASGLIDTSTPGPVLTQLGQQQAEAVVGTLGHNNYDAIYGSSMVRTQLTAAPMSQYLRLPIQVLPGLQEIEAGVFEGTPEANAQNGYGLYPIGWTFPGVIPQIPVEIFNKSTFMPGTDLNGFGFDARVDGALQTMYDKGDRNPVVFSHGGTIMFWTMMNVQNLSVMEKLQLLQTARLDNTDFVVIEGNNEDGWTLVNWNGQQFAPEPTLAEEVKLQTRTLTRQLAATAQQIADAIATRNIGKILTAISRGVADAAYSVVKFQRAINAKIEREVTAPASVETSDTSEVAAAAEVDGTSSLTSTTETSAIDASNTDDVTALRTRTSDTTPSDDSKLEAVEVTKDDESPEDTSNGATDLADGNKTTPDEQSTGEDGDSGVGQDNDNADTDPDTADSDAGATGADESGGDGGQQSDAA